jgi:hypothetical protein
MRSGWYELPLQALVLLMHGVNELESFIVRHVGSMSQSCGWSKALIWTWNSSEAWCDMLVDMLL